MYLLSKRRKCRLKIVNETFYMINALPYVDNNVKTESYELFSFSCVTKMFGPIHDTRRNITCDAGLFQCHLLIISAKNILSL